MRSNLIRSSKARLELDALLSAMLQAWSERSSELARLGAGSTRLGKVELVQGDKRLRESLLIRARQGKYTSIGRIHCSSAEKAIYAQLDHRKGLSVAYRIRYQFKRGAQPILGTPKPISCSATLFLPEDAWR